MSLENKEALKNIHLARGEMYSFLSRVFANVPDDDFYTMATAVNKKLLLLGIETVESLEQPLNAASGSSIIPSGTTMEVSFGLSRKI